MSHIRTKEKLLDLKKYLKDLGKEKLDKEIIESILEEIVPKDKNNNKLTGIVVKEKTLGAASYMPNQNLILINTNNFENICEETTKAICNTDKNDIRGKIKAYYRLFALLHESEHAYQFAIAKDKIPFKYQEVKEGYKNIVDRLIKKNYIIPRPIKEIKGAISFIKYQKNAYDYVLERNASTEALDDILELIKENEETIEVYEPFDQLKLAMSLIGYFDSNMGCMYNTHKGLYLLKEYNKIQKDEDMTEEERLRFGLNIKEGTRAKLL